MSSGKPNQLNRGETRRLLYFENKDGDIDGVPARIGWATFSKSGKSVYYRGRTLSRTGGQGIRGNYRDEESGDEYWVSGVKQRGSNNHPAGAAVETRIDPDALDEYRRVRSG